MTTLREAAQQALEALEETQQHRAYTQGIPDAITALRDALAQEEQEPVAWRTFDGEGGWDYHTYADNEHYRADYIKRNGEKYASWIEPLYTHPPQELTKEDVAQNLQSRHDAAKLLEERRQEIAQPRREWQGLTTQEAMSLTDTVPRGTFYGCDAGIGLGIWIAAVAAAERALKEKNA